MRGFPLRAAPELVTRTELPRATVTVERVGERAYVTIEPAPGVFVEDLRVRLRVVIDSREDADALAATLRAAALLLPGAPPEAREEAALALERAAAGLRVPPSPNAAELAALQDARDRVRGVIPYVEHTRPLLDALDSINAAVIRRKGGERKP